MASVVQRTFSMVQRTFGMVQRTFVSEAGRDE